MPGRMPAEARPRSLLRAAACRQHARSAARLWLTRLALPRPGPRRSLWQKRCKFTEQAVEAAGLANVRVHWGRAEDAGEFFHLSAGHRPLGQLGCG